MTVATALSVAAIGVSLFTLFVQDRRNKRQQFETSFISLLSAIRELVNNTQGDIIYNSDTEEEWELDDTIAVKGLDYYRSANRELRLRISTAILKGVTLENFAPLPDNEKIAVVKKVTTDAYNSFFDDHISQLAHYFRFLYNVVDFIDSAEGIRLATKRKYVKFIQAQMLSEELTLLFYNGIAKYGMKFYPLLDRYGFLQNINPEDSDNLVYILYPVYSATDFRFINKGEEVPSKDKVIEQVQDSARLKGAI